MDILGLQWENIKQNIQVEYDITDIAFNIWVKPLKYGKCENKVVTILIPNTNGSPEMLKYIEKNYTSCFQSALSDLLQDNYNVKFLLEFDRQFPGTKTIYMNDNYRSTPEILQTVNSLIEKNQNRLRKDLIPHQEDGPMVRANLCENAEEEAK